MLFQRGNCTTSLGVVLPSVLQEAAVAQAEVLGAQVLVTIPRTITAYEVDDLPRALDDRVCASGSIS